MQLRIWSAITVAAFAWGTNGVATRSALNDGVPPVAIAEIRAFIAVVVLYLLLRTRHRGFPRGMPTWRIGLVQGLFQLTIPYVLFTIAYDNASAGFVGLLVALIPLGTAIGAGLPIIDTLKNLILSGDRIHRIRAVLSGSLNFIFNSYDGSIPFASVVREAQAQGYTEPDPRIDLSGVDVMRKILILARESL